MRKTLGKFIKGYCSFRKKYVTGDNSIMQRLAYHGQRPKIMVISCCDSRVDPSLILQCDPGDLFVVRNVANIVPPCEMDKGHHGTSAALEFGICYLNIQELILLGHSQCGGIEALMNKSKLAQNDFITSWVSLIEMDTDKKQGADELAKSALNQSYNNCLSFPWIKERVEKKKLTIHRWFFDIKEGRLLTYSFNDQQYHELKL